MDKEQVFTNADRDVLVTIANAYLADENNSQEDKEKVFWRITHMLHYFGVKGYNGFNWIKWYKQGGASQFFKDYPEHSKGMTPELNAVQNSEKYMGKEYDRFFY